LHSEYLFAGVATTFEFPPAFFQASVNALLPGDSPTLSGRNRSSRRVYVKYTSRIRRDVRRIVER